MSTPKRLGMGGADDSIGGWGIIAFVYGPPIAGTVIGAVVDKKHRVRGGAIGLGAGVAVVFAWNAYIQAKSKALVNAPPVAVTTLKNPGYPYTVSSTTGGDVVAQATAAGFHVDGSQPHGAGPITAVWEGANGAAVPAGLSVMQSAALAQ